MKSKQILFLALVAVTILSGFSVQNVYGALSTTPTKIAGDILSAESYGNYQVATVPEGIIANESGTYITYVERQAGFVNSFLIFQKITDATTLTSRLVVDATTGNFGYVFKEIAIFVNGTTVDIIVNKQTGGVAIDIVHYRSTDDGVSFGSGNVAKAGLVGDSAMWYEVDGDRISILYKLAGFGGNLEYVDSVNAGASFSTTVIDDMTGSGNVQANTHQFPQVTRDGADVFIAFQGNDIITPFRENYFFSHSADSGATFDTPFKISTQVADILPVIQPYIFVDGTNILVIFNGAGGGLGTPYMVQARSTDSGETFSAQEDIYLGTTCEWDLKESGSRFFAQDETDPSIIHVICLDETLLSNGNVFTGRTTDFGANWSLLVALESDTGDDASRELMIDVVGQDVYYAWSSQDDDVPNINTAEYRTSDDGGVTFGTSQYLQATINDLGNSKYLLASIGHVILLWQDASGGIDGLLEYVFDDKNAIPVITLIGSTPVDLVVGESYLELGASCVDLEDGILAVTIGGDVVDTSSVGTFIVDYDCVDSVGANAVTVQRTVSVTSVGIELTLVDIICPLESVIGLSEFVEFLTICGIVGADPPVITIIGDVITEVVLGATYVDLGATAFDNGDGDLTSSIVTVNPVNTNIVDAYLVTYDVFDSLGNIAVQQIRTVVVASVGTVSTGGGGAITGSPVSTTPDGTGVEGFTESQQMAFDEALANAIASIPLTEDSFIEELIQTFFEFTVLDSTHEGLVLQSFLDNERLGLRWSTGDDIVLIDAIVAPNPFLITFEQFPVIKSGSGAFVSTDILLYNLEVPRNECGDIVSLNCVQKIRYEIPITVQAVIDGTQVQDTATITVDLTEEDIDIILVLVLAVGAIPVGAVLINRLRGGKAVGLTTARRISG